MIIYYKNAYINVSAIDLFFVNEVNVIVNRTAVPNPINFKTLKVSDEAPGALLIKESFKILSEVKQKRALDKINIINKNFKISFEYMGNKSFL